ncbi:hypothetical protein [Streptomyces sp. NPDC057302]|uniref:hypothetical protein n=1 Tax=Streptomyces sp. NPDC057302 TaxID=3346094 RepID=UPI00363550E6
MNWDAIVLSVLAAFGAVVIALSQLHEALGKVPAIIRAWHEIRRTWRETGDDQP